MILTFQVNKPLEYVFEHLSNMQKFVEVHPIIFKAEKTGENEYLIFEKLKLFKMPFTVIYPAKVIANADKNQVNIHARVKNLVRITISFQIENRNGGTKVTEDISLISLLPVKQIMKKIFSEQHSKLFKNIENAA